MSEALLHDIGNWTLAASFPPILYFVVSYGIRAPWWRTSVGVMFFTLGSSILLIQTIVLLSLFLGAEYPGRSIVRLVGYGAFVGACYLLAIVYEYERRSAHPVIPLRKEQTMSNLTPGPDHAGEPETPTASFLALTRKAWTGGLTAAIPVTGTAVAAALADGAVSQGDVFAVIAAAIGSFALAFGAVYRVPNAEK